MTPPADRRLRPATEADRGALVAMMARLQDHERAMEENRRPGAEMAAPHIAALLGWIADDPAAGCLIAEGPDGEAPLGFILWGVETEFGDFVLPEARRLGRISDLWLEPRGRGTGLARAMIAAAEAHLAAHGIRRVEISALSANAHARAVYAALGYRENLVTLARWIG
ncbi:hypothetical protein LNKW23_11640 [Paralimibaculum aggregatum]|uniref:N-acetyltransferase domain-containing protein n=1 Tax=Paralimibaculum aggregatum TaxID=3036245 RepID=A0ABQ6LNE8_9RHOB|nr:GNAT family N-acetyltransferase [Limibaculum sp. NKW23]GMG81951.1 hypothetical protein LNKW23_11640 [Limibaculum sp. NKW23]